MIFSSRFVYALLSLSLGLNTAFAETCRSTWLFPPDFWDQQGSEKRVSGWEVRTPEENVFEVLGDAQLTQEDKRINADEINYHRLHKIAHAFGHVRLQDPDYLATSDRAVYNENTQTTQLYHLNYQLRSNSGYGQAEYAEMKQNNSKVLLKQLTYTGCPIGKEEWWLRLDELNVDDVEQSATAKNALLEFKEVPVFYFPWLKFSTAKRASGLLMPTVVAYQNEDTPTNSLNSVLKIPYYFDIAPNIDDTLTLIQMADRGQVVDNEFRYWLPRQKGALQVSYLNDQVEHQDRYRFWWKASQQLDHNWALNWDWHDVSDANFYREIQLTNYYMRNKIYLDRSLKLSKDFGDAQLSINMLDFKQLKYGQPYYSALPQVNYAWQAPTPANRPLYMRVNSEFSHFLMPEANSVSVTGSRLHLAPTIGASWWQPYGFVHAKTQLLMTQYSLTDNSENTLSRVVPVSSIDVGLIAEKPITLFNHDFIHTIEPRAKYLFVPKVNQSQYPVFDTMPRSFDYLQLFADNRFTGLDRIGDANQVTTGLFSSLNHADGREFVEFGLGQISYFQSRQVQMPGVSEEMGDFSDLLATASVIYGNWRATLTEQIDRDTKAIRQEDRSLQYVDAKDNHFIVRHRLRRQGTLAEDEQITLGGQLHYNATWSSLHFANLNQTSDQMRSAIHAVQYDSCCWGAQLIWEHNLYINDVGSDIIRLAFIFKGLTTFGSLADQKIDSRLYFE